MNEVLSGCAVRAAIQQEEAVAETSGAAQPPKEAPPVAVAAPKPPESICPETGVLCEIRPQCDLKGLSGRTYCFRWVKRIKTEEIQRREDRAKSHNP